MSTNWLDPEYVKRRFKAARDNDDLANMDYNIVKAIAELPEPKDCCDCGTRRDSIVHVGDQREKHRHEYRPSTLHRIWRVAQIASGKEA